MPINRRTIRLADGLNDWVEKRISSGFYADRDAYFAELVERDKRRGRAEQTLASMVDEARRSGVGDGTIATIMAGVAERLGRHE